MIESAVTDKDGRYGFLVRPGDFYLTVQKKGYTFPSQYKVSGYFESVYTGGNITIKDKEDQTVMHNIPLDPQVKETFVFKLLAILIRINRFFQKIHIPLIVIGFLFAISMLIAAYNIIYLLSIGFYALILALDYLRLFKARPYGIVSDVYGHPLDMTIVRIFEKKTGRLFSTDVTDAEGRFRFLVNPGIYYLTAAKPGYIDFKSHIMYLEKEKTSVSANIKLNKETDRK
jgi:hypothetical protein